MIPRFVIFWALLLTSCGYALWRGRKYESLAAIVFLSATVLSVVGHFSTNVRYLALDGSEVVIDSAVLISLVAIALFSDRFWPLWAAGLQLVDSTAHIFRAINLSMPPWAYAIAERFWSYPILVILFFGAWRSHRRDVEARRSSAA
jgi:hypothetical protein